MTPESSVVSPLRVSHLSVRCSRADLLPSKVLAEGLGALAPISAL